MISEVSISKGGHTMRRCIYCTPVARGDEKLSDFICYTHAGPLLIMLADMLNSIPELPKQPALMRSNVQTSLHTQKPRLNKQRRNY